MKYTWFSLLMTVWSKRQCVCVCVCVCVCERSGGGGPLSVPSVWGSSLSSYLMKAEGAS